MDWVLFQGIIPNLEVQQGLIVGISIYPEQGLIDFHIVSFVDIGLFQIVVDVIIVAIFGLKQISHRR